MKPTNLRTLDKNSLKILKDLFLSSKSKGEGVDSVIYRAQHEDRIDRLDLLERNGYLRKDNDKYWVTLVGLKVIGDSTTKKYFDHFEKIFSVLRKHYKTAPKENLKVVNLASMAGLTFEETAECLGYMIEGMWWAGRSHDLKNPEAIIKPSESILKYKTSHDVIAQLQQWRDEREAQDSALSKGVGNNLIRNHIRRRPAVTSTKKGSKKPSYVDELRLAHIRGLTDRAWDFARLIRLCEELNVAYEYDCYMATAMVVRAIVDHVPPVFGYKSFGEFVNNYPGAKSFRGSMKHLDGSLRNVADANLHVQIRSKESVPTPTQVDFRADLDVLLAEIVRFIK